MASEAHPNLPQDTPIVEISEADIPPETSNGNGSRSSTDADRHGRHPRRIVTNGLDAPANPEADRSRSGSPVAGVGEATLILIQLIMRNSVCYPNTPSREKSSALSQSWLALCTEFKLPLICDGTPEKTQLSAENVSA